MGNKRYSGRLAGGQEVRVDLGNGWGAGRRLSVDRPEVDYFIGKCASYRFGGGGGGTPCAPSCMPTWHPELCAFGVCSSVVWFEKLLPGRCPYKNKSTSGPGLLTYLSPSQLHTIENAINSMNSPFYIYIKLKITISAQLCWHHCTQFWR